MTTPIAVDGRPVAVEWANFFVNDNKISRNKYIYTEGAQRMSEEAIWPLKYPFFADCSAFVTVCYSLAGMHDPNGQKYNHTGYTGTLLANGRHIDNINYVHPGDIVVYGTGTGSHAAIVVEVHAKDGGRDILTASFGQQGDPSYCWVDRPTSVPSRGYGYDGRHPQTFLAFDPTVVRTQHHPKDIK